MVGCIRMCVAQGWDQQCFFLRVPAALSVCRKPTRLHYMGVSFGLTQQLFNFWQRSGYEPMYIRQNASETTGELP